ncbi:MAG: hypothetical protein KGJ23_05595 [Euryarchaeota archaeon]|nr:hypothetical protein [Euryarchaeota archaeon]MDE1836072.1 hypothetical protein [Euryarchaeota archaeon]MDE1879980.1 hypothetical protein [Euryarchaeota archaeon]MDE2044050.1 hypothetical protein [Thermoplasmata archaeon]
MGRREATTSDGLDRATLNGLLASRQPSVRYYALTELLGRPQDDPEVRRARSSLSREGWARDLLATQGPEGFWEAHEPKTLREWVSFLRFPVFQSSVWKGMVLSDLGLTSEDPRIRKFADRIFQYLLPLSSPLNIFTEEACIVGNVARMLTRLGYGDDRRVRKLFDWMLEDQRADGGWNCAPGKPGTLDAWEPLSALAAVPKPKRSAAMERAIDRGLEFYLERKLFQEGRRYLPWFRFHYPTHYYYDVLVGLEVLTSLGAGGDRRLGPALRLLREKQRSDGWWNLDRVHPDEEPSHPAGRGPRRVRPLALEKPGERSLWTTLTALRVLHRVQEAS